jgi:hypothetical protein
MSKLSEILGEGAEPMQAAPQQQAPSMGFIEAATEGVKLSVKAFAPGLTLGNIFGDIGHELKEQLAHGAHEAAAVLFNGSAFVMYPHAGQEQEAQSQQSQAPVAQENTISLQSILDAPTPSTPAAPSMERDMGREM